MSYYGKRYYSTDYRNEVISALNSVKKNTSPNLSSGISAIEPDGHMLVQDCKTSCLNAAHKGETHIGSIDARIDSIIQGITAFYNEVQLTGEEISRLCENVEETMEACINAFDSLKDLLGNATFGSTDSISKSDVEACFEPLDIAEENNSEYIYEYFTDENGFVNEAAVQEAFDKIEAGTTVVVDENGNETYILTPEAEAYAKMYAQFEFEYLTSDEITPEKTEWLYNVNIRCSMSQSNLPVENMYPFEAFDGDKVVVCESYDISNSLKIVNDKLYELNLEYYNSELFGQDTVRDDKFAYVTCFVDATDVIAQYDHICAPCITTTDVMGTTDSSNVSLQLELPFPEIKYEYDEATRTATISFPTAATDSRSIEHLYLYNAEPYDDPTGQDPVKGYDRIDFSQFNVAFESSARNIFNFDPDDYSISHLSVILSMFGYDGDIPDPLNFLYSLADMFVDFPCKSGVDIMWLIFDEACSSQINSDFDAYKFYMYLDSAFNFHGSVVTFTLDDGQITSTHQQPGSSLYYYDGDLELFNNYVEYLSDEMESFGTYQDISPEDIQSMDEITDSRTLSYQDYKNLYDSYWNTYCDTHDYTGDPSARLAPAEIIDQLTALIGQDYTPEELEQIIADLP